MKNIFLSLLPCLLYISTYSQTSRVINGTEINVKEISKLRGENSSWSGCADYCRNLDENGNTDWRMPSFEETIAYRTSGEINLPDGWASYWTWTSTPYDSKVHSVALPSHWLIITEAFGEWAQAENDDKKKGCRCVR